MMSFCSSSNDRLLTKRLIESSNSPSKSFHRFVNTPEWADGLDIWSSSLNIRKNHIDRCNIDFHEDLGLYLPRYNKINLIKQDFISSKGTNNDLFPERLRQLFKKEKELLLENNSNISSSNEQLSLSENNQSSNHIQQSHSNEITSNKLRFPLRQVQSNQSSRQNKSKQNYQSLSEENLKSLLKQQLNSLFTRETTNINHKRTLIRIPSVQIKHQNFPPKTVPVTDPTSIMERYAKMHQLLITPPPSQPTINNSKFGDNRQSPLVLQGVSNLGLTVTPLDVSSAKHLHNSSSETISQQDNHSSTNHPSTQPVPLSSSTQQNEEQQRIILKRSLQTGFISSSGDFVLSNAHSLDEQTQTMRRFHRHHRSLSKSPTQRPKTFQLLPPFITGKRLQMPLSNHRHS